MWLKTSAITLLFLSITAAVFIGIVQTDSEKQIIIRTVKQGPLVATSTTPQDPDAIASSWTYSQPFVIEEDILIEHINISMENAPIDILHHVSVFIINESSTVCGLSTHAFVNEIYTASRNNIRSPVIFQKPYGIRLNAGTIIRVEFMEHTREQPYGPSGTYNDPTLVVTLKGTTKISERARPVLFVRLRLDDTPCQLPIAHQSFTVPAGSDAFMRRSTKGESDGAYRFNESGSVLNRSANIWPQKGGVSLSVYINDELQEKYIAQQLSKPWQWTIPHYEKPIRVKAGDLITIEAKYQNTFQTSIKDASGIFGFYFAPDID